MVFVGEDFEGWGKKKKADDGLSERQGETANSMLPLHHQVCLGFLLRAFHDNQLFRSGSLLGCRPPEI